MCTFSWWRDPDGVLEVWFNRDELKSRPVADPPSHREENGKTFLSPRDPKGGGTWMLVNDHGVLVCLLNRWGQGGVANETLRSRGRLVWEMAGLKSPDEARHHLENLQDFRGFTLVVMSREEGRCFNWNGQQLSTSDVPPFLTSSSYRFEEVREARAARFQQSRQREDLHASRDEEPSAYTVRMNRPDAQTWSRSQVRIGDRAWWRYLAEQPELAGPAEETVVELALR